MTQLADAHASAGPSAFSDRRVNVIAGTVASLLTLTMLVLLGRVYQLQTRPGAQLAEHMGSRTSTIIEPARRGDILDRRGRVLSATRFGQRLFVDPEQFPKDEGRRDASILRLAEAMGVDPSVVGTRIVRPMATNEQRVREFVPDDEHEKPTLIRYVPMGMVDDARLDSVKQLKIPGVHLELSAVRVLAADELAARLVGKVGAEQDGLMGAEKAHDQTLDGTEGRFSYVRDAKGRPLWVEPNGYVPPVRGQDLKLSIDLEIQQICADELHRGVVEADAQGGRIIALDPNSGEVLAMIDMTRHVPGTIAYDWEHLIPKDKGLSGPRYKVIREDTNPLAKQFPALARNRVVEDLYEPGSTFKPFMWAASTELGLARPSEIINTHWGQWSAPDHRHLSDVVKREFMTWADVLVNSSNIGMVQVVAKMTHQQARDAIIKFGFGTKTNIGLGGESPGIVTPMKRWSVFTQTSVAYGHEVGVTPLQMVRAFSAFAREGEGCGLLPDLRLLGVEDNASVPDTSEARRAIGAKTALLTRETMRGVTHKLDEKLAQRTPPEGGWQYELFGKSGTAETPLGLPPAGKKRPKGSDGYYRGQYTSSFIAGGPVNKPRVVMLCVIDDPGPERIRNKEHYGSMTAGPVVRRSMERVLSYLGVPPSPPAADAPKQMGE